MPLLAILLLGACERDTGAPRSYTGVALPKGNRYRYEDGLPIGGDCTQARCRSGLVCRGGACAPSFSSEPGAGCFMGDECQLGHNCLEMTCAVEGDGEAGASCISDDECRKGLRCALEGLVSSCVEAGLGDLGGTCDEHGMCRQGLYCLQGACGVPEEAAQLLGARVECPEPAVEEEGDEVEALFFVPGALGSPSDADFFALPYPNDIRTTPSGQPDLEGFPVLGSGVAAVDLVERYRVAVQDRAVGFSNNTSVLFRFSGPIDSATVHSPDGSRAVAIVDLDDQERGPLELGVSSATGGRGRYVCDDWLGLRATLGTSFEPGHRYAAWVTTAVRSKAGRSMVRSQQLDAVLRDRLPEDSALHRAHERFAPLRAYLARHAVAPSSLLNATVFTVGEPKTQLRTLSRTVAALPPPPATGWVRCEGPSTPSPCAQAEVEAGRACGALADTHAEYHFLLELPIFQEGDPPYIEQGGGLAADVVRRETVCASLTVPTGPLPAEGVPLIVFAHGTGGSFRSHLSEGIASVLASSPARFAVLGIDQVQHGTRRGNSQDASDRLYFNFNNPDAARGNPLQGALDQLSLLTYAESAFVELPSSAQLLRFSTVLFWGHSQGATQGALALPFGRFAAAVLSGHGGSFLHTLLEKTRPNDIAHALPLALGDLDQHGKLAMGDMNPALGLMQHYVDGADPLHFARFLTRDPAPGFRAPHVFQVMGFDDAYSPERTMSAYARAVASLRLAPFPAGVSASAETILPPWMILSTPISGNWVENGRPVTVVGRKYISSPESDGHFVAFEVPAARRDVLGFLEAAAIGEAPQVPAP